MEMARSSDWWCGILRSHGNSNNGIQYSNAIDGVVEFNKVSQNGLNGISYSGNSSRIHDNVVTANTQFGIFVRDGVDHQVWNNTVSNNASGDLKIQGALLPPLGGRIFYVDVARGNDSASEVQAQNDCDALEDHQAGAPSGQCRRYRGHLTGPLCRGGGVAARRYRCGSHHHEGRGARQRHHHPPSGSGVYIGHHHHVVEGLAVTAAATGLQMGPYKTTGAEVVGLVARENHVYGNGVGIKFGNVRDGKAMHNVIHNNGKDGISYSGSTATIFNNLVYANGINLTGEYGITMASGNGHQITSNTVYGNNNGGIRLGTATATPVLSTVLNNIVVQNPVGIKEPAGSAYTGRAVLDYNDVHGNSSGNYQLSSGSGSVVGSHSISLPPAFINPANADFRLSRQATGQPTDSPVIDVGSDTAEALGLGGRTAFTDKFPDVGKADLGYHGTLLRPAEGTLTIGDTTLTFDPSGDSFTLSGTLQPGEDSDEMEPGVEYVEVTLGNARLFLPAGDSRVTINKLSDGSIEFTVNGNLDFGLIELPTLTISFRLGDDFGSTVVTMRGTLQFP